MRKKAKLLYCDCCSVGKAERIWEVADLPTLFALPCSSAAQGSRGEPMLHMVGTETSRGDAPNALEPYDPMLVEISSFSEDISERSRIVSQ